MATLIQSKQIEGIVTASVVTGEFLIESGSFIVTGSNSILGPVTASSISSSFVGDGSGITGITYSQVDGTPQFVGGNNVTITSSSNVITVNAILDGTGSDAQNLTISGDQLTILGGNTITIPTGSNVSDYFELSNIPQGIVSSSIQILGGSGILSGSKTDITLLNTFSSSIQSEVDSLTAATSSYLTSSGSVNFSDVTNKPSGLVSSSDQITITESQISDLTHYGDSDVKTKLDVEGVISGSLIEQLPSGLISGSEQLPSGLISGSSQITITQSQISDLVHTDVTNLNTFTSSIQSEVDSLTSATSSYITEIPQGTISGSQQVINSLPIGVVSGSSQITITESQISDLTHTQIPLGTISGSEQLPSGLISSSDQITITESQISDLDKYTNTDVQTYIDSVGVVSGSVVAELPSGTVSGSQQVIDSLPTGVISGSEQLPHGLISGSEQLPSGLVSSSDQITITESQISDLSHTDISNLNTFTSSIQSEVDSLTAATSSYLTSIDSGIVSSSTQVTELLPDGVVSGSSQITITESQISDLTHYTDSDVKTKLDTEGVISGSLIEQLPSGVVSGSTQITDGSGIVSSSTQVTELLPDGVVSGSTQLTDGSGIISSSVQLTESLDTRYLEINGDNVVSSSQQIINHLPSGIISGSTYTNLSSSVHTNTDLLQEVSGANYIESSSVNTRLDIIEGSVGAYYDVSNTVWNQKYIRPGSEHYSDALPFNTNAGNNLFTFRLNDSAKLNYLSDKVVYIHNFDRDTKIVAQPIEGDDGVYYNTGSREVTFKVLEVNGNADSGSTVRINDSYWILSRHTAGFVDSATYTEASESFDYRIDVIVASGSGANWNVNLTNIPQGIVSGSEQQYSASIDNGFAFTSSLNDISTSLDTKIENVYLSSSNFDAKSLVSGSSQIDFREVTNYVADEHIDHTTININAGDGLDGGGDISSTRELRLNVTSSHFTSGVGDVLTTEGVVKQSTLDDDIVGTDFSQSVDTRLNAAVAGTVPSGTVSGSTQVDIEQTQNYTAFSSSIATSIAAVDGGGVSSFNDLTNVPSGLVSSSTQITDGSTIVSGSVLRTLDGTGVLSGSKTDVSLLNTFTSSAEQRLDSLETFTSSLDDTYATDSELSSLSASVATTIDGIQHTQIPSGTVSGSDQLTSSLDDRYALSGSSIDTSTFATTGSNTFSGSQFITGSIIPEASGGNGLHDLGSPSNPFRELYVTTGSVQFVRDGNVISKVSGEKDAIRVGNILITTSSLQIVNNAGNVVSTIAKANRGLGDDVESSEQVLLPDGTLSGSQQITDFGFLSGSLVGSGSITITSGSGVITISSEGGASTWDELSGIPDGLISESQQVEIDDVNGFTAFSSSVDTRLDNVAAGNVPSGTVSSSAQITYDGDRVISNDKLGDLFTDSVNPGTSGSVIDFLNAVFYPNSAPAITTGNQTIEEYTSNGSTIVTIVGTDPEGQTLTFGTSSAYTDDLVRVASNGVMTLNALPTSASFNTDAVGGGYGHKVEVTATDTFGTITEKDIYIIVTPNEAPKFRETSVSGNIITSVTSNLNENSANNTLVKRIYFTDAEGDTITITTGSIDNEHFDVTIYSNYLDIRQNTGSLDYEQQTTYTFSITASDEHYEDGDDLDSVTYLPITINVTDNLTPTISDQTLSSINENSADGVTVGSISAADNESDTITFQNFELHQLQLDGSVVTSGSYGGTSQLSDPHENPFQMNSSGIVTRKTGVYLNSDLINKYIYRVEVTDSYNGSNVGLITIDIDDDTPATISDNWSVGPYIKESELSGTSIKTTDYGSTQADYGSNQSGTWSSSNSSISINSNGNLSLGVDLSGSVTQSGDTIDSTITFTNTFGTTTTDVLSVSVVGNDAPIASFTNQSSNFNTNLTTQNTNLVSVSITDTEGDTPYQLSLSGTNASSFNAIPQNSNSSSWQIQASSDLSAGTYNYDVNVTDNYGESTSYNGRSVTIVSADDGTLATNGTFYIIESATNGDLIRTSTNGRTGTQATVAISYSPNYGSQTVSSFTSSNGLIDIDSNGRLSVGTDISGSGNTNGDVIATTITWTDQYGNTDSSAIAINVSKNNAPTVLSTQTFNTNTNEARGTSEIVRLNVTDTESDSIPNSGLTFSGYNTTYFTPSISTPQMKLLANSTNIPNGTYPYTASIQDVHGFDTTVHSGSVTIVQSDTGTLGGDTAIYIVESAVSGDVFTDQTGFEQGSPAQLSVSYSPSDGSPVVQSYTSSNDAIVVDGSGNLTLGLDISGSVTQSGDTITTTITFTDQYDNIGSGSVTATVFGNSSPSATFTATSDYDTDASTSGSTAGTLTVTDTENNSPFTITLAGTDGDKFDVSGSSSPFTIQPTGSLTDGSYSINITVTDTYGESVTLTGESITVDAAEVLTTVYIYTSTRTGGGTLSDGNYDGLLGITSEDTTTTPDTITGFQSAGPSPIFELKDGHLGDSSISVGGGTLTLQAERSGSNLDTIISSSFNGDGTSAEQIMILFPSGSTLSGIPTSMTDSLGGSTTGEYVLYLKAAGEAGFNAAGTQIHQFDVDTDVDGYGTWNIIGRNSTNTAASYEVRMIPSSGSAPS